MMIYDAVNQIWSSELPRYLWASRQRRARTRNTSGMSVPFLLYLVEETY